MTLHLNIRYAITFMTLTFLMHEAHEIIHTSAGRIICGCWGLRDFNVWELCAGCTEEKPYAVISTFLGPLFTFTMMWLGAFLMESHKTLKQKTLGFSLVFANMPFARLFSAAMGGGDEVWGLTEIFGNYKLAWIIGLIIIIIITFIPLFKAYKLIENKRKFAMFLLFFLAPFAIDIIIVLGGMNTLLQSGVGSTYIVLGSPVLVTVWTILVTLIYILTRNNIYTLSAKEPQTTTVVS